jgi:hypothetical protein
MIKKLLTLVVFSLSFSAIFCQFNYQAANATKSAGTYTDLGTNGTAITTGFSGNPITFDDDTSSIQNIGFNFSFNGTTFTQFLLCTNGFIKLGTTPPASIYDVLAGNEANTIYPYNYDLDGGTSPEYRVFTSGIAGSRVCTIQFKNVKDWSSTTGQYSNINFQIKLYETSNEIEFVYGTFTSSGAPASFLATNAGIQGSVNTSSVNITKSSASAWTLATFLDGNYTGNKFNNRNNVLPTSGYTYKFTAVSLPPNDAAVLATYTLGKIPAGYGGSQIIRSMIRNNGSATLTNLNVSLAVTGANTFSNTQTITSLAPGVSTLVSFTAFTPTLVGTNTITVTVPSDDVNTNNSSSVSQTITANTISTTNAATATLGVGLNGSIGEFAAKFTNSGSKTIDQITLYFPTTSTGQPYTAVIYDATGTGGTPGTALWTSASQTSGGANVNLSVTPGVVVTGDFFVSVQQTGTTNLAYGYETENPIRSGTFYLKTTGAWSDMSPGNNFKLMFDARFSAGLPVQLSGFTGIKDGNKNVLKWNTITELNNKGFDLQRSLNGIDFSTIASIASKAINGNSNATLEYEFNDATPLNGNNYYRLQQTDKDGKTSLSQTVLIRGTKASGISIAAVYPNPVKDRLNITISSGTAEKVTMSIIDVTGKVLIQKVVQLTIGELSISENISQLNKGNYLLKLTDASGNNSDLKKIVKQ